MLIKNISMFLGNKLEFVQHSDMRVLYGRFASMRPGLEPQPERREQSIDGEGLVAVPGFVNCHTHVGDSIAKDISVSGSAEKRIHPMSGIKPRVLGNTAPGQLADFMRNTCHSMLRKGITTFVDFREGGIDGVELLAKAVSDIPIRAVILGRLDMYQTAEQIRENAPLPRNRGKELAELLRKCDGLGISGANENSDRVLQRYSRTAKLRAIHSAESVQSVRASKRNTGMSEVSRALHFRPNIMVHMTHATASELATAARDSIGIVACPRANAALAEGIPDVRLMQKAGCTVALGTDNVMINSPDMFREMDYLWKVSMAVSRKPMDPCEILKMATVNGGVIMGKKMGLISRGMHADCIFLDKHAIDLEPMHNPHASVVHRASEHAIRAVMVGGRIVHGSI